MAFYQTIEISETQHGLVGFGNVIYKYNQQCTELHCKIGNGEWILYEGVKAKEMALSLYVYDTDIKLVRIKQIASDACGIPYFRIYEKIRKEEMVFSRYLVIWLMMELFNYTDSQGGDLFELDRCTALHAIKVINKEDKYFKVQQSEWKSRFMIKLRTEKIISPQEYMKLSNFK